MNKKMGKNPQELSINFDSLLKQGFGVIDVRYRNYDIDGDYDKFVIVQFEGDRGEFYPQMLKKYTGRDIKEKDLFELWTSILIHKLEMSNMLDRDISIKVAALDHLESND